MRCRISLIARIINATFLSLFVPIAVAAIPPLLPAILSGVDTSLAQIPYQAKLIITKTYNSSDQYYLCGGSIIDNGVVLTAAHCVENEGNYTTSSVAIYFLDYTTPSSPTLQSVMAAASDIEINAGWTGALGDSHDIAVIYLSGANFTNAKKIKVATSSEIAAMLTEFDNSYVANQDNTPNVQASGYGQDEDGNSGVLQRVLLAGISEGTCSTLKASSASGNDTICVQSPSLTTNYGICSGDSGGPLVWQNPSHASDSDYGIRLTGIASYVTTDGGECRLNGQYYYGAYTNISFFKSEINNAVDSLASTSGYDYESLPIAYSFDSDPMLASNAVAQSGTIMPASSGGGGGIGLIMIGFLAVCAWSRKENIGER